MHPVMLIFVCFFHPTQLSSIDIECADKSQRLCWERNITNLLSADIMINLLNNKMAYNRMVAPNRNGTPVTVWTALYIESMSSFKAETMDYQTDMYLAIAWFDKRLEHPNQYPIMINDLEFSQRLWIPDFYFVNSKSSSFQSITTPNFMMLVYPDGLVFRSARYDVTFSCMMDFTAFPMDEQLCPIIIQTFSHVKEVIRLEWFRKENGSGGYPISHNANIQLNDMSITGKTSAKCIEYPYPMFRGEGFWDCLVGHIRMKRRIVFYILQTYVPTTMLVFISWLSFWLDPKAAPARISLPITTLLTLVSVSNGARQGLPQVSYIKAIDVWLTVSTGFIFCTLLEYTIVNYVINKRQDQCKGHADDIKMSNYNDGLLIASRMAASDSNDKLLMLDGISQSVSVLQKTLKDSRPTMKVCDKCTQRCQRRAKTVDQVSRVMFPSLFAIFSLVYWVHYLSRYNKGIPLLPVSNDYGAE